MKLPQIALTMGDVSGIGPQLLDAILCCSELHNICRPIIYGNADLLRRASQLSGSSLQVASIDSISEEIHFKVGTAYCIDRGNNDVVDSVPCEVDARSGQAAYDYLVSAIDDCLAGQIDAITTAPLNKESLRLAGIQYPGHTEVLADRCRVDDFGMMLYLPHSNVIESKHGLGIVHATLHTSIDSVAGLLKTQEIYEKIGLISSLMKSMGSVTPRIAVCALNPHAGEHGLFGNEESQTITPAVVQAQNNGFDVTGPLPADTLIRRAVRGEFDAVVAMYHDQGHIPFKLLGFDQAVNITLGLPIIRTSPSHGTAFDIAWTETVPDTTGIMEAIKAAAKLAKQKTKDR